MLDKITGEGRLFINKKEQKVGKNTVTNVTYNFCIGSNKNKDGTYTNCYMLTNLSKKLEEEVSEVKGNYIDLVIKDSWFTCYKRDKEVVPIYFINSAKLVK